MDPRITIIIPNWNRRRVLRETLAAISADLPAWAEVIVVDNASTDGAAEMVRAEFGSVGLIRLRRNVGTAARNIGLQHARGKITLMLDNDSHPLPGALERIEHHFEADERLGALGGRIFVRLDPPEYEAGGLPGVFIGCGAAFRTEVLRGIGGYPEDYGFYVEEYDVSCRLLREGWRMRHAGDVPIHHRKVTEGRDMNQVLRRLVRNNLKLWRRFSPPGRYWAHQRETVFRYFRVACKESATAGYWRGLAEGLPDLLAPRAGGGQLTEDQHRRLFGLDQAERLLADAIATHGRGRVAVFGADKGLPQILDLLSGAGLAPGRKKGSGCFFQIKPLSRDLSQGREKQPDPFFLDWAVVGSLSPGNAENLRLAAATMLPSVPTIKLCDYAT